MKIKNLNIVLICYRFSGKTNYLVIQNVKNKKLISKIATSNDSTPTQKCYNQFLEMLTFLHSLSTNEKENYSIKNNALLCIDLEKCYDDSFEIISSVLYDLKDYFLLNKKWEDVCQEVIDNEYIEFLGARQYCSVSLKTIHSKKNELIISTIKKIIKEMNKK